MILSLALTGYSQSVEYTPYNHPELEWRTIETEHFYVHFHQGTSRTAAIVAKIAEDIYQPITDLYQYTPDTKVHFVVRDHDDNANGAAFYYGNKIEIWAPPADFLLRSDHDWLRNVVTHEYSHMISLGAMRKMPRQIPAVYFQWMAFEPEKRQDVLHGYPNRLFSVPYAGTVVPMWFAEGMAQFQRAGFGYDTWDAHRDMLLRTAALKDELLSINEMGVFGKNSLGNERTYCQGYALTLYISYKYGEEKVRDLARAMKAPLRLSFSGAAKQALGLSDSELYNEWTEWLSRGYQAEIDSMQSNLVEGELIQSEGIGNVYPIWSPDSSRIAFLSNEGEDYLSLRSVYVMDVKTKKKVLIKGGVSSSVTWSPDSKKLIYSRHKAYKQGSSYFDLFLYDLQAKKETQLTHGSRARLPHWSPDGTRIVSVTETGGTSNLALLDVETKSLKTITAFENGEQITSPKWMDNETLVFALFSGKGERDIATIKADGSDFKYLIKTEQDERDPAPDPNGQWLYFSSNKTGIFNIYRYHLSDSTTEMVSNVSGGAFMPAVNKNGQLVFARFESDGYKIALLDSVRALDEETARYTSPYSVCRNKHCFPKWDISAYDDTVIPKYESKPYRPIYSKFSIMPRFMVDYPGKPKVGAYVMSSDFMDIINVFGGFAANQQKDTDGFLMLTYNQLYPSLFAELYHIRRHSTEEDREYAITFMGADIGADWKINPNNLLRTAYQFSRYDGKQTISGKSGYNTVDVSYGYTYHLGNALQLKWLNRSIPPAILSDIAPQHGFMFDVEALFASQRFIDDFKIDEDYGTLVEVYSKYKYFQISGEYRRYFPALFNHSIMTRMKFGYIDRKIDDFYYFYAGGMDGLKGYPFYGIEGRKLVHLEMAYRFPIWTNIEKRLLFLQFDDLFASLYGQVGDAFLGDGFDALSWKRSVGAQLRLSLFEFYGYPMRFFADGAYGLDEIKAYDSFTEEERSYGKEWRFYFGLLFDFLD